MTTTNNNTRPPEETNVRKLLAECLPHAPHYTGCERQITVCALAWAIGEIDRLRAVQTGPAPVQSEAPVPAPAGGFPATGASQDDPPRCPRCETPGLPYDTLHPGQGGWYCWRARCPEGRFGYSVSPPKALAPAPSAAPKSPLDLDAGWRNLWSAPLAVAESWSQTGPASRAVPEPAPTPTFRQCPAWEERWERTNQRGEDTIEREIVQPCCYVPSRWAQSAPVVPHGTPSPVLFSDWTINAYTLTHERCQWCGGTRAVGA